MAMEVVEMSSLDPVMLAVLKGRLEQIVGEMDATSPVTLTDLVFLHQSHHKMVAPCIFY